MRLNLRLLLSVFSLYGFAQFYVNKDTSLSLGSPQVLLSSQKFLNKVDTPIIREGTLILNNTSAQKLTNSQDILELPTLRIETADLVRLETALQLQHQEIEHGQLQLNHQLLLPNPRDLKLGGTAAVANNSKIQLLYATQFQESLPLVLQPIPLFKYTISNTSQERPQAADLTTPSTSSFGSLANLGYKVYFTHFTPPPKVV